MWLQHQTEDCPINIQDILVALPSTSQYILQSISLYLLDDIKNTWEKIIKFNNNHLDMYMKYTADLLHCHHFIVVDF